MNPFPLPVPLPAWAFTDVVAIAPTTIQKSRAGEDIEVAGEPVLLACRVQPANPTGNVVADAPTAAGAIPPSGLYRVNIRFAAPLPPGLVIRADTRITHVSDQTGPRPLDPAEVYAADGSPVNPGLGSLLVSACRIL